MLLTAAGQTSVPLLMVGLQQDDAGAERPTASWHASQTEGCR